MKISIFPNIKVITSKEDKKTFAKFGSNPHMPETMEVSGIKDLIKFVTAGGWSASIFQGFRKKDNFKQTDMLVLDIDNGLSFGEALNRVQQKDLMCICLPSSGNTKELSKFRLIFPLAFTVETRGMFQESMKKLVELFPEADPACVGDEARLYFNCVLSDEGFVHEGMLFTPLDVPELIVERPVSNRMIVITSDVKDAAEQLYGEPRTTIPEAVAFFIQNAPTGLDGIWNQSLNAFGYTLGLQNIEYDLVYQMVDQLAPDDLDSNDEFTLERSYNQGCKTREAENA